MLLDDLRTPAARLLSPGVEQLWRLALAAGGRLHRPAAMAVWDPRGDGRVLAVSPHPDDETLGCGGTLLRHRQAGDRVVVVQVTDGRASGAGGLPPEEMVARRGREAAIAADRLGVELLFLGLPEGGWAEAAAAHRLRDHLSAVDPAVVYAPSPIDYHPEHLKVARALATALPRWDRPVVRVCELGVPLTATLTNLVSGVTAVEPLRQAALAAYATQIGSQLSLERLRRYNAAFWGMGAAVECFWELTPAQYQAVVAAGDWSGRPSPFRGFRRYAVTDPLCYLQAQHERRRLSRVAAAIYSSFRKA